MRKQKYIVPAIVCVNAVPQGETCGQPEISAKPSFIEKIYLVVFRSIF